MITRYYTDPINDDFAGNKINTKPVPDSFKYVRRNPLFKLSSFLLYRVIARPFIYLFLKLYHLQRFENKKLWKKCKNTGYFMYGNHTLSVSDAYIPNIMHIKKRNYIIANPDATSIKGIRDLVMMLGCLPLPNTMKSIIKFKDAVSNVINKKDVITIYPEAHIWPHYTDIRPFNDNFLTYQVELNAPCFCFVNVAKKRKFSKRPKVKTVISGPFYPDENLSIKDRKIKLRDEIYTAMKKIVDDNNPYKYKYDYIYKQENVLIKENKSF